MLSTGALLASGWGACRRQRWAWWPLYVATVLGRLLGLVPAIFLFARFLHRGLAIDSSDLGSAFFQGAFAEEDFSTVGAVYGAAAMLGLAGSWLLGAVMGAGALKQLAAQAGHRDVVPDEMFAEGVFSSPARYLMAGALAEFLKLCATAGSIGSLLVACWYFLQERNALGAFAVTFALGLVIIVPATIAALEVGFARAVILSESPVAALGEGLLLAGRRVSDYLPAWYVLAMLDVMLTGTIGFARVLFGGDTSEDSMWIINLMPAAALGVLSAAGATLVQFWRLGVAATLVAEDAGMIPEPALPPPPPRIEPVLEARVIPIEVGEVVLEARAEETTAEEPGGEV